MAKDLLIRSSAEEFITFKVQEKDKGIQVRYEKETLWMTQRSMAELFDTTRNNMTMHIRNIFEEGELQESSVSKESLLTAKDGKNYNKYLNESNDNK